MTLGGDLPDIRPHDCVYATRGWGIHDERWVAALLEVGRSPFVVAWNPDETDALEFREQVAQAAQGGLPVLAGPLDTVAPVLLGLGLPLVGLSWGYDLTNADARGDDLSWIGALSGVIVDSVWNQDIVVRAGMDPARVTYLPWGVDLQTFVFHGPWIDAFELGVPPQSSVVLAQSVVARHAARAAGVLSFNDAFLVGAAVVLLGAIPAVFLRDVTQSGSAAGNEAHALE